MKDLCVCFFSRGENFLYSDVPTANYTYVTWFTFLDTDAYSTRLNI